MRKGTRSETGRCRTEFCEKAEENQVKKYMETNGKVKIEYTNRGTEGYRMGFRVLLQNYIANGLNYVAVERG